MGADCECGKCSARRVLRMTPLHLKAFDDTKSLQNTKRNIHIPPHRPFPLTLWSEYLPIGPECNCNQCQTRVGSMYLLSWTPTHLKAYDDTSYKPWSCECTEDCDTTACCEDCDCLSCKSAKMSTYPWTVWALPGALYAFESAYEYPRPHHPIGSTGVDYDRCDPKTLRSLINQRGLEDPFPAGLTLKFYYIRILETADRECRFRFMDLPPEMRNLIYESLLLLRHDKHRKKYCFPRILSTCREIHAEATGILYGDNAVDCSFGVYHTDGWDDNTATVHNTSLEWIPEVVGRNLEGHTMDSFMKSCDLPTGNFLRRITTLNINICIDAKGHCKDEEGETQEDLDWVAREIPQMSLDWLSNSLLAFSSSLTDGHAFKNANIGISLVGKFHDHGKDAIQQAFYPLRRLHGIKEVCVTGDLPADFAASISSDMQNSQSVPNTLAHMQSETLRALAYIAYCQRQRKVQGSCKTGDLEGQVWELRHRLPDVDTEVYAICSSEDQEREEQEHATELEDPLNGIPTEHFIYGIDEATLRRATLRQEAW